MANETQTLQAEVREASARGKGPAKRLRAAGKIPAVIYGGGAEATSVSVDPILLKKALNTPRKFNTVLTLKLDKGGEKLVLIKDFQQHPVTRTVRHVDFAEVKQDVAVVVDVPVVLSGKAEGVIAGGMLTQIRRTASLSCLPLSIPESIVHDVTTLKVNQTVHEADLVLGEGVKLATPWKNETIAVISAPEVVETPAAAAAAKGKK